MMDVYQRQRDFDRSPLVDVLGSKALVSWVQALRDAVTAGVLPAFVVATALAYTKWSDENGKDVWPSHATIGRMVGKCARTIGRHYKILVEAGFLDREHRYIAVNANATSEPAGSSAGSDQQRVIPGDDVDVRPTSNMTRLALPDAVLEAWRSHWAALRSAAARKAAQRRRDIIRAPKRDGRKTRNNRRGCGGEDCVLCSGSGWVEPAEGSPVVRCTGPPTQAGDKGRPSAR